MKCDYCGYDASVLVPVIRDTGYKTPINGTPIPDSQNYCLQCIREDAIL